MSNYQETKLGKKAVINQISKKDKQPVISRNSLNESEQTIVIQSPLLNDRERLLNNSR